MPGSNISYLTDENNIKNVLDRLSVALTKYPRGLFDEFASRSFKMNVYLVEKDLSGQFAGLASRSYQSITMTNTLTFDHTFHHEMMHYMEFYLGYSYFTSWNTYNPPGFNYYGGNYRADMLYLCRIADVSNIYFTGQYSRHSGIEDRATVFQDVMMNQNRYGCYNSDRPLSLKATYLFNELERGFNSINRNLINSWGFGY